jgi:hypothetical protein
MVMLDNLLAQLNSISLVVQVNLLEHGETEQVRRSIPDCVVGVL